MCTNCPHWRDECRERHAHALKLMKDAKPAEIRKELEAMADATARERLRAVLNALRAVK